MIAQGIEKIGLFWQSGVLGKTVIVVVGIYGIVIAWLLLMRALLWVDSKWIRRCEATGTIMRKYLELPAEDGCWELEDSKEARRRKVCYMVDIHCTRDASFKEAIDEGLYDIMKVGDQLPMTYEEKVISGNVRVIEMSRNEWEWQDAIDKSTLH